jgi:putative endonuclease
MNGFHYVYLLESITSPAEFYIGLTADLQDRLRRHNTGLVYHTAKNRPWQIRTAVAFRDRTAAAAFERYLKSGSGRAFAKRHF